jgi:hypothetical protein
MLKWTSLQRQVDFSSTRFPAVAHLSSLASILLHLSTFSIYRHLPTYSTLITFYYVLYLSAELGAHLGRWQCYQERH